MKEVYRQNLEKMTVQERVNNFFLEVSLFLKFFIHRKSSSKSTTSEICKFD
jgi:hypothetical protein